MDWTFCRKCSSILFLFRPSVIGYLDWLQWPGQDLLLWICVSSELLKAGVGCRRLFRDSNGSEKKVRKDRTNYDTLVMINVILRMI